MIAAYLRVSTEKQHLANQQDEIRRFAAGKNLTVDRWVTEIISGKKKERIESWGNCLKISKPEIP